MTKTLRKRHLQAWTFLAILLPVGIISGWLAIPKQPNFKILQPAIIQPLPVVFKSLHKKEYLVNVRTNDAKTAWQMEWINKCVLTVPSAVIYMVNPPNTDPKKGTLIGRIESTGNYIFPLTTANASAPFMDYILYDFIHEKTIDIINLK